MLFTSRYSSCCDKNNNNDLLRELSPLRNRKIHLKLTAPLLGCTYKWSKLELGDATSQGCSTHKNKTSCEGIRSLALKKAPEL